MRAWWLLFLVAVVASAAPTTFVSGARRTHLLELYSSEGCSSCPPAEHWLGALRDDPGLWRDFVPIAFHVTYWDRLGWPDRFARREFTDRQYAYATAWGSDTVYTPAFVLDGAEWRRGTVSQAVGADAGTLTIDYADGACRVAFDRAGDLVAHVALLGAGIVSSVRSGENAGRTLRHDFVALVVVSAPLVAGKAGVALPIPADKTIARHAIAAWVTRRGDLKPLQATGGWLD
ncbi:MAG TPA: DUF1223 domain-containing protein [Lacunisphaera sp.]|nr:DUF1223 domain-containing protein [Lacunisphaera sp.]